jgi:hypothetical protein
MWLEHLAEGPVFQFSVPTIPGMRYVTQTTFGLNDPDDWRVVSGLLTALDYSYALGSVPAINQPVRCYRVMVLSP